MPSEDRKKYELLLKHAWATIDPKDIFEEHWVSDVTHQIWEAFRYRRLSAQVVMGSVRMALEKALRPFADPWDARQGLVRPNWNDRTPDRLAARSVQGDQEAIKEVDEILLKAGITREMIEAEAAAMRSIELQRISLMLGRAESRRNATLKAIERHRTGLGEQLRRAAQEFEASELAKLQTTPAKPKLAA